MGTKIRFLGSKSIITKLPQNSPPGYALLYEKGYHYLPPKKPSPLSLSKIWSNNGLKVEPHPLGGAGHDGAGFIRLRSCLVFILGTNLEPDRRRRVHQVGFVWGLSGPSALLRNLKQDTRRRVYQVLGGTLGRCCPTYYNIIIS